MRTDNIIRLSFDDSRRRVRKEGSHTIASMVSYFSQEHFDKIFSRLGFRTLPDPVLDALDRYGYKYDYKLGGWCIMTTGVSICHPDDRYDEKKGMNIAMTKAKVKAYKKAMGCIKDIMRVMIYTGTRINESLLNIACISIEENSALERCKDTGFCKP